MKCKDRKEKGGMRQEFDSQQRKINVKNQFKRENICLFQKIKRTLSEINFSCEENTNLIASFLFLLLLIQFRRNTKSRIKLKNGSDSQTKHPFIVTGNKHQHPGKDQKHRT